MNFVNSHYNLVDQPNFASLLVLYVERVRKGYKIPVDYPGVAAPQKDTSLETKREIDIDKEQPL